VIVKREDFNPQFVDGAGIIHIFLYLKSHQSADLPICCDFTLLHLFNLRRERDDVAANTGLKMTNPTTDAYRASFNTFQAGTANEQRARTLAPPANLGQTENTPWLHKQELRPASELTQTCVQLKMFIGQGK
jgi:hypothetical protein